jgi:hypothetical protein
VSASPGQPSLLSGSWPVTGTSPANPTRDCSSTALHSCASDGCWAPLHIHLSWRHGSCNERLLPWSTGCTVRLPAALVNWPLTAADVSQLKVIESYPTPATAQLSSAQLGSAQLTAQSTSGALGSLPPRRPPHQGEGTHASS